MKKLHLAALCATLAFILVIFTGASNGPAYFYNTGYTAAPFDGGIYCTACHGGGSFTPVFNMELLDNNNLPVTHYTPHAGYTLHLSLSSVTGPVNKRYGFQVVPASSFTSGSGGVWGTLPADVQSININGRDYAEHTSPLTTGDLFIPWSAPAAGNGTVTFYAAGNIVNYNFDASGDNPVAASLAVTAGPLSDNSISLYAERQYGHVLLKWTGATNDAHRYIIERGSDGRRFEQIEVMEAGDIVSRQFIDRQPLRTNYYRVARQTNGGIHTYSPTVRVETNGDANAYHYIDGNTLSIRLYSLDEQKVHAAVYSLGGQQLSSSQQQLSTGERIISVEMPATAGIYIVTVSSRKGILYNSLFATR